VTSPHFLEGCMCIREGILEVIRHNGEPFESLADGEDAGRGGEHSRG